MRRTIYTEEHEDFRLGFRQFLDREAVPYTDDWEDAGVVDRSFFEAAGKAKGRATVLRALGEGVYARVRPIEAFAYVAVLPAARKGTAKLFLATASGVAELAGVIAESCSIEEVERLIASASPRTAWPEDLLLGTICFHVGGAKTSARTAVRPFSFSFSSSAMARPSPRVPATLAMMKMKVFMAT